MANNRYSDYGEGWRSDRDRYGERERRYGSGREYGGAPGERRSFGEDGYGQGEARYGSQRYGAQDESQGGERRYGRATGGYGEDGRESASRYYGGERSGAYGRSYGGRSYGGQSYGGEDRNWMERAGDRMAAWFNDDDDRTQTMGQHRGRGPKGYRRSDDRIREDVCDRLSDDPMLDASGLEVRVQNGEVTLEGTVNDREDKRRAEMLAERCSGVDQVQNNVRVQQQTFRQNSGVSGGAVGQNEAVSRVTEGKSN